jgi:hypothetical protein
MIVRNEPVNAINLLQEKLTETLLLKIHMYTTY